MKNKSTIFLTGATGFLGSHLLVTLLKNDHKVFALARGKKGESSKQRLLKLIKFWNPRLRYDQRNLVIVNGDITEKNCGITTKKQLTKIIQETEIIYHGAAIAEMKWPLDAIRKVNVEGTRNILELALLGKKHGSLKKVNHISTAYVVGDKNGIEFSENMLKLGQGFYNTYEQSKYEAELLVHEYIDKELNVSIFRPSMVMGDSKIGKTNSFKHFYTLLHLFTAGLFDKFPTRKECICNVINIDTVTNVLYLLGDRDEMSIYHAVSPNNIKIGNLFGTNAKYINQNYPKFVKAKSSQLIEWSPVQRMIIEPFVPFLNNKTLFLSNKTNTILSQFGYKIPKITKTIIGRQLEYCQKVDLRNKNGNL